MFLNRALPNITIIPKQTQITNDNWVITYSHVVKLLIAFSLLSFLFLDKFNIPIELCKSGKKKTILNKVTGKWITTREAVRIPFVNKLQFFILK